MKSGMLLQIDIKQAAGQKLKSDEFCTEAEIYHYLAVDPDLRKAELLAEIQTDSALVKLKAFLSRGRLEEVKKQLEQLTATDHDEFVQSEILIEKARLAAHEGDWMTCLEFCNAVLALKPALISILSTLQIRAVALFELGHINRALKDIEMVLGQAQFYPQAVSIWFGKILRLKILARTSRAQSIEKEKSALWDEFCQSSKSSLNLMQLLSLLRLEIDLCRLNKKPSLNWSKASLVVADRYGDELYRALALLEYCADSGQLHNNEELALAAKKFKRVQRSLETLLANPLHIASVSEKFSALDSEVLLVASQNLVLFLKDLKVKKIKPQNWYKLFSSIGTDGVSKQDFFEKQWGQKYKSELHDGVLRTYLHRQRRQIGLPIKLASGRVYLEKTNILTELSL